jgi:hypothetical protein
MTTKKRITMTIDPFVARCVTNVGAFALLVYASYIVCMATLYAHVGHSIVSVLLVAIACTYTLTLFLVAAVGWPIDIDHVGRDACEL